MRKYGIRAHCGPGPGRSCICRGAKFLPRFWLGCGYLERPVSAPVSYSSLLSYSCAYLPCIDLGLHLPGLATQGGSNPSLCFCSVPRAPCRASLQGRRSSASTRMGAFISVRWSGSPLRPSMKSTLMMAPSVTISTLKT